MVTTPPLQPANLTIRVARPEDAGVCGRIAYDAFRAIATQHNFPFGHTCEALTGYLEEMFSHPHVYCVVAEWEGEIVGSNCMDERAQVFGIGPITIAPHAQDRRIGRGLMENVLQRATGRGAAGVRLVQAAYHSRSLVLYAKLGFEVREPLSVMQGSPLDRRVHGYEVRPATEADLADCDRLCRRVHGHDRHEELHDAIAQGTAMLVERKGNMTGYASNPGFRGHAVAETNDDLQALIAAAPQLDGPGLLVPSRNGPLLRWCLEHGLRIVYPMTLMTVGLYNEPAGAYLPSVKF